ncbi:hypothetical protein, partial [Isoptericola sp. QY 916]|nr:PhoH family protein [Isoptericola sp. QY 916]
MTSAPSTAVRLVAPEPAAVGSADVVLDATQEAAVETALAGDVTLVVGAPGTGRTTVATAVAVRAMAGGEGVRGV